MIKVFTSDRGRVVADIIENLAKVIGHGKAGLWMLTACPALGHNISPVMALKDNREAEVRTAAAALIAERNGIAGRVAS
jgi:hypothetical protein